jgi:hypothetical protein
LQRTSGDRAGKHVKASKFHLPIRGSGLRTPPRKAMLKETSVLGGGMLGFEPCLRSKGHDPS